MTTKKPPRPRSGLDGWGTAWAQLAKIDSDRQRDTLATLVRNLGVQGAPALEYAAQQAMWLVGVAQYVAPRRALRNDAREYVERRVREELAKVDRKLFPRMSKQIP
jgi:hypothetical protein